MSKKVGDYIGQAVKLQGMSGLLIINTPNAAELGAHRTSIA